MPSVKISLNNARPLFLTVIILMVIAIV